MPWPIQKEIPSHGEGEQSTNLGGPWPNSLQPPLCCTFENDFPFAGAGVDAVFELEVEVVVVELPLAGAGVPEELVVVEVPEVEDVPVLEVLLVEEVPVPVFAFELALESELPEHPFNSSIHDRRVIKAAHCNKIV